MPRRPERLTAGVCYHVYDRGNNRQTVFFSPDDYALFIHRLRGYLLGEPQPGPRRIPAGRATRLLAYCLMPDHYHLLLVPGEEDLSHRMQLLSISFTKAMNARHTRVGSLFQGQFQAIAVDQEAYLLHLTIYLHLNPVRAGLTARPEEWPYSSYQDYVGLRHGSLPSPDLGLSLAGGATEYERLVDSFSDRDEDVIEHLLLED